MTSTRFSRVALAMATIVLVAPIAFPEVAQAGVDDARREVERIVDQLDRLETQADTLAEDYAVAVDEKSQLDDEVSKAEDRIAAKEAELSSLRGDLAEVAVRAFTGAGTDVLGPLFSSPTKYGDGLQRDQYSRVALSVGTTTTDDLDELIASLDKDKRDLESKRAEAERLTRTITEKRKQTEELRAKYEAARADAEARYADEIRKEEERRAAAAFARLQAEAAAQQAAARQAAAQQAATDTGSGSPSSGGSGGSTAGSSGGSSGSGGSGGSSSGGSSGGSTAPPVNIPAVSGLAGIAVQAAYSQLGVPYRYATSLPGVSFDCSGLTHYAWGQAGVYLPRNSRAQAAATPHIPASAAQPGDLIFYYSPISHVGIYVGNGNYIHAPSPGDVVKISPVRWQKVTAVSRPG